jgi:DNA-nicking Smr family endonuclease
MNSAPSLLTHKSVRIDLHGSSVQDTKKTINRWFLKSQEEKPSEIYFITGRGNHVPASGY